MSPISLGKINLKMFTYLSFYIATLIILGWIDFFLNQNRDNKISNILLNESIDSFCYVFLGIPEYIIREKYSNKDKEKKAKTKNDNKVVYLYTESYKPNNWKNLFILIISAISRYIYIISIYLLSSKYYDYFRFASNDNNFSVFFVLYLYIIFKIIHKIVFYKHQNLSLLILILLGLIKFFTQIFAFNKFGFVFPKDLLSLIILFIYPIIPIFIYYIADKLMKYKYYSPYFIGFLIGIVEIICSIIMLSIFLSINCEESSIFYLFCEINEISKGYILIYLLKSLLKASLILWDMKTIKDFTVFHVIILISFDPLITSIYKLIDDFDILELILIIIIFIFEVLAMFVFVEIIELNFWGFNLNLKKNIRDRGTSEVNLLFEGKDEENEEDNNRETMKVIELSEEKDENEIY